MRTVLCIAVLVSLLGAHAGADEVADAMAAMAREDTQAANTHLVALVESENVAPERLFHAAWIALQLEDRDVLERVRAVGEGMETESESDAALDLALAAAYLGLAEDQVRTGTGGSSTSLLFADAETRSKDHAASGNASAAYIAARTRYAQGDLPGALQVHAAFDAASTAKDPGGAIAVQRGAYLYEHAVGLPAGADGRMSEAAAKALGKAAGLIEFGIGDTGMLAPKRIRRLKLTHAWALHRLGKFEFARIAYLAAHKHGGATARLARRGLASLFARDPQALVAALGEAAAQHPTDPAPLDDLIRIHTEHKRYREALLAVQQRTAAHPKDPAGFKLGGDVLARMGQHTEAVEHYAKALALDEGHSPAAYGMERVAQQLVGSDFDRALAVYERLLVLRPKDPFARNNLGFILREKVSPWTKVDPGGIQRLKPDAPDSVRRLLIRCRDAYASAVALIPESEDESRDMRASWNLAGIVNDYGLMVHYFADIQDAALAERLYHRTLRMTEDGFKDTYSPNLQRLYAFVLKGRELSWYRVARRCKDAILMERPREGGGFDLVPDARKRRMAATDETRLRAWIVQQLGQDAAEDGSPWPPKAPGGKGR